MHPAGRLRPESGGRSSMVEPQIVVLAVAGSSPVDHPIPSGSFSLCPLTRCLAILPYIGPQKPLAKLWVPAFRHRNRRHDRGPTAKLSFNSFKCSIAAEMQQKVGRKVQPEIRIPQVFPHQTFGWTAPALANVERFMIPRRSFGFWFCFAYWFFSVRIQAPRLGRSVGGEQHLPAYC